MPKMELPKILTDWLRTLSQEDRVRETAIAEINLQRIANHLTQQ